MLTTCHFKDRCCDSIYIFILQIIYIVYTFLIELFPVLLCVVIYMLLFQQHWNKRAPFTVLKKIFRSSFAF